MSAKRIMSVKYEPLTLRIKPAEGEMIGRAAGEALIDQRIIMIDPDSCQKFIMRMGQIPSQNVSLRKTMQTAAPWEQKK
ncbi:MULTISPECIES: hypothetical protein [unclassified Enterobacter]|uniref:hypothetical protein n=1 Tax=unclassified Enterobacter TaxID=2608935 RepID=UPI000934F5EF|nr:MULTISPECIES: hypothetical protein [unclassified Enterobacter]WJD50647.1 CopG family transcriptional regulator [Enterobacter sp. PGRG2]